MKSPWPLLALLLLGAVAVAVWALNRDVVADVDTYLDPASPVLRVDPARGPELEFRTPASAGQGTEANSEARPGDLVGPVTFRFVDGDSNAPVPGVRVMRSRDGQVLGIADDAGHARVSTPRINTLVFAAPGYLLDHYFDRREAARALAREAQAQGWVRVPLRADTLMTTCELRFVAPDGEAAAQVRFRVRCEEDQVPDMRTVPDHRLGAGAHIPPELRAAWQRHVLLGSLARPRFSAGAVLHLGSWSDRFEHAADDKATLRCLTPGVYLIEASSPAGFRRQRVEVVQGGSVTVQLRTGVFFQGRVVAGETALPVAMAGVTLSKDGDTQGSVLTDEKGQFRLGPLPAVAMVLEIHHPEFAPFSQRGVVPGGAASAFRLQARPKHLVRGVVRRKADGAPVAEAVVRVRLGAETLEETRTDEEGRFEVKTHLVEPTLEIRQSGFLTYAESFNANGSTRSFELIPDSVTERVRLGLSGVVEGQVFDKHGKPAASRPVRAQAKGRAPMPVIGGRRVLRGGTVRAQELVHTDAEGRFRLEWPRAEAIELAAPRPGQVEKPIEQQVTIVLGRSQELVFRDPR